MVACVVAVMVSVGDACDASRVTIRIIVHSISGKPGEGMRQIIAKCDQQRAIVNPQVSVLGMLFTNLHVLCVCMLLSLPAVVRIMLSPMGCSKVGVDSVAAECVISCCFSRGTKPSGAVAQHRWSVLLMSWFACVVCSGRPEVIIMS